MRPAAQYTDLTYMGGAGACGPIKNKILVIIFGVNRTLHVPKTAHTDLIYMAGTGLCGPIKINFGHHIKS